MKQSVPKSAGTARPAPAAENVADYSALKTVATALAAKLTATLAPAPDRRAAPTTSGSKKTTAPQAKASTKREKVAKEVSPGLSGTLAHAESDTGPVDGAVAAPADQFENSVVSKVSEVMTKTNKSTPAAPDRILTDEEILKMDEKDYMNAAQMAFFKAKLQALEKELLKNAGETTEHLRETVLVPDPADRATIEEEHALELRTRDRERKLLKKVQQSIVAIDGGDYGWCEETGEPIGIPRLIARPTATLSLEAQQRRELKQKLYGD